MAKYLEIVDELRERIVDRRLVPDQQLPSEAELGEEFSASRGTVRRAIEVLASENLVHALRGSGTYVSAGAPVSTFFSLSTFEADMRRQGRVPSSRVLLAEAGPATQEEAERLDLDPGDPVVRVARLRLADGVPVAHEHRVVSAALCPGILDEDLQHVSMHWLLTEKYRLPLRRIEHVVDIRPLDPDEAAILAVVPGTEGAIVDRRTFTTPAPEAHPAVWFRSLHLVEGDVT